MEDTPALPLLIHCAGPLCVDEIAQPSNKFWKPHVKAFRRRGGPMFCRACWFALKFQRVSHDLPTHFDRELEKLGLVGREQEWSASGDLRKWASRHASAYYVPENLLARWQIQVNIDP